MKKVLAINIFLVFFLIYGCKTKSLVTEQTEEVSKQEKLKENLQFYVGGTLTEIVDRANSENKPVFIDFTAAWCAPCKLMDEEIYSYKSVYEFYNSNFINYRIDIEKENGPNIAFLYEINVLPALIFLDKKGRIITKTTGSVGIQRLLDMGNEAVSKFNDLDK